MCQFCAEHWNCNDDRPDKVLALRELTVWGNALPLCFLKCNYSAPPYSFYPGYLIPKLLAS